MRIFGLEITKAPKLSYGNSLIWARPSRNPIGTRILDLTPDELRAELAWVRVQLQLGYKLHIGVSDKFQRILVDKE